MERYGYDVLLGSIAAFYVIMIPYTKVEESFNVQVLLSSSSSLEFSISFNSKYIQFINSC